MARYPSRPVRRVVRWYSALLPLVAAVVAASLGAAVYAQDGNKWCADNAYSCSVETNLVGVVAIGGATTYWYYGFRRGVLLGRYRRRLRAYIRSENPENDPVDDADDTVATKVFAAHRRWRSPPRVTLLTGSAGSGKKHVFARTITRLARPWNWSVPVPLGGVTSGNPEDLLDSAKRQLELILLDVNASQDLIDSLWRSLLRCGRLLLVADDIEEIAPSMSSAERELIVQRLFRSAERLRVPLLGTGKPDLADSAPGLVLELARISDDVARGWLVRAARLGESADAHLTGAVVGALATPTMVERLVWLLRRCGDTVLAALQRARPDVRGFVLWDHLLAEHVVPDAAVPARELRILAFALLRDGRLEAEVPDSGEWRAAVLLAGEVGARLRSFGPNEVEVRSYIAGGFLDPGSNRRLLRLSSPEVQATLAAGFLADQPDRVAEIIEQLGTSAAAREAVADALRLDADTGRVHSALLGALGMGVSAASEAAGLCLAIRHPPAVFGAEVEAALAGRLTATLADRASGAGGPVLGLAGLRDAVMTLDRFVSREPERYLLQALHSSSFQVRLAAGLALLRRRSPEALLDSVEEWIAAAESPSADGIQHQLGLALWFCPFLRETDPTGPGGQLYERGLRLAMDTDANPLMFETSLCRGFKLAAWVHPDHPIETAALDLLAARPRFWYSRISLVHTLGIRLASPAGGVGDGARVRALAAVRGAVDDRHPLVAEAARLVLDGLAAGRPAAGFAWLAETDMARSNSQLEDRAQRLLGDVSLLLNLIYCAEPWPEPVWRFLAEADGLPDCIRRPALREEYMRHGCPSSCPFGLCPYPGPSRRGRGRGELSGLFCRAQADLAGRLPRAAWQEGGRRRQVAEFWEYAEDTLANRDGWEINL
jgi:hypothetical protein